MKEKERKKRVIERKSETERATKKRKQTKRESKKKERDSIHLILNIELYCDIKVKQDISLKTYLLLVRL